jgi:hypothetical protein
MTSHQNWNRDIRGSEENSGITIDRSTEKDISTVMLKVPTRSQEGNNSGSGHNPFIASDSSSKSVVGGLYPFHLARPGGWRVHDIFM